MLDLIYKKLTDSSHVNVSPRKQGVKFPGCNESRKCKIKIGIRPATVMKTGRRHIRRYIY